MDTDPPKPPTKAEILEDLETFNLDHVNRTQRSDSTLAALSASDITVASSKATKRDRNDSENEQHLEEWWDTFEKFLGDIDKLEMYQKQFASKKANLAKLDETIGLMADDIQTRITDSLEKAMAEVPESEPDLK